MSAMLLADLYGGNTLVVAVTVHFFHGEEVNSGHRDIHSAPPSVERRWLLDGVFITAAATAATAAATTTSTDAVTVAATVAATTTSTAAVTAATVAATVLVTALVTLAVTATGAVTAAVTAATSISCTMQHSFARLVHFFLNFQFSVFQ
jgi:hypothetical protein